MTEWFVRRIGSQIAPHTEDERMVLIGDGPPDWIRIPDESPEGAGRELKVIGVHYDPCAKCMAPRVRHLMLEDRFSVAQCFGCGFVFYRRPEEPKVNTKPIHGE